MRWQREVYEALKAAKDKRDLHTVMWFIAVLNTVFWGAIILVSI